MQESRGKFEERFFKLLAEDISTGGGALGTAAQGGTIFNPLSPYQSEEEKFVPGDTSGVWT